MLFNFYGVICHFTIDFLTVNCYNVKKVTLEFNFEAFNDNLNNNIILVMLLFFCTFFAICNTFSITNAFDISQPTNKLLIRYHCI